MSDFVRRRLPRLAALGATAGSAVLAALLATPSASRAGQAHAGFAPETLAMADAPDAAPSPATGAASDVAFVLPDLGASLPRLPDTLLGYSGKLRARFVAPARALTVPVLAQLFGDSATRHPGVYEGADGDRSFALVTLVPFDQKQRGRIGSYRMGSWPVELGTTRSRAYANPAGFIRVTPDNQDTYVSEHFRLREFLTKDQFAVWPKYLVLREPLLDKLELLMQDLDAHGTPARHMSVMSGFRTPQYNEQGVGAGGRAQNSRHQYGDAADVFVDNDGDGRLDDLNGDGRVNTKDVQVMLDAVERVERRYPQLVGGAGVYKATSAHGPFIHVDVRGNRARWGLGS